MTKNAINVTTILHDIDEDYTATRESNIWDGINTLNLALNTYIIIFVLNFVLLLYNLKKI